MKRTSISLPDVLFALSGVALGIFVLVTALGIENTSSYARVPPNLFPLIVGIGFIVVSAWLLLNAFRGDKAEPAGEEDADPNAPTNYAAIAWVSVGVLIEIILLNILGFVFASSFMFACVAQSFRHIPNTTRAKSFGIDFLIGLAVALISYIGFTKGLGISLPAGFLPF
jgi:putative tricarboxylic transport membrane protein